MEIKEIEGGFKPIKLQIVFNSKEELIALYHRMNVSLTKVKESVGELPIYPFYEKEDSHVSYKIWEWLDNKLDDLEESEQDV